MCERRFAAPETPSIRSVRNPFSTRDRLTSCAAGWSSSVARRAHNPEVVGSNPAPATETTRRPGLSETGPSCCPLLRAQMPGPGGRALLRFERGLDRGLQSLVGLAVRGPVAVLHGLVAIVDGALHLAQRSLEGGT